MEVFDQHHTDHWSIFHGDAIEVLQSFPGQCIDFCLFSPAFLDLFTYSDSPHDLGNCTTREEFFQHFDFVVQQLARVVKPGRNIAVHCIDIPAMKERDGHIGLKDFPGDIIRAFEKHDFIYHSRHTIWKDPLIEATRTKALGLMHKQLQKDSIMVRAGLPDYLLCFRNAGANAVPIAHPDGLRTYAGANDPTKGERGIERSHNIFRAYASPVWMDIRQTLTLNVKLAREAEDEKHLCLARDSLVLTKNGYLPIQDVQVGDFVLTHCGRWRPVIAKQNTGVRPVVLLRAHGVPGLRLTPDHKLWARKVRDIAWARAHSKKEAQQTNPSWVEAQETIGSYINLKLPPVQTSELSAREWWIVGRWLADGHQGARGEYLISVGPHKLDNFLEVVGDNAGTRGVGTAIQVRLKALSEPLRNILCRCGRRAENKIVPGEAFALPQELAEAILSGYLSGDGHHVQSRDTWTASSVSKTLLMGIAFLVHRARGEIASVYPGRPAGTAVIEGRTVDTQQDWILRFEGSRSVGPVFIMEDGAWKKVRSIIPDGEVETWNLRVAEDESYTAEGCIVKNCPLQLDVIERCLTLWSNPGEVVLSPFMGIGSEVWGAVMNGRRGIGVELKGSYFQQAKRILEGMTIADRRVQEELLFATDGGA